MDVRSFRRATQCVLFLLASTFLCLWASGRTVRSHGPGSLLTFTVSFGGKDAGKITQVTLVFTLESAPRPGQEAFLTTIAAQSTRIVGPHTFEAAYTVPYSQAAGVYAFSSLGALARLRGGRFNQITLGFDPAELHVPDIAITNPSAIERPVAAVTVR